MKNLILLIFFLLIFFKSNSQDLTTEAQLEMKYWEYRYRFLGDDADRDKYPGFISIGDFPGACIPIEMRNKFMNSTSSDLFGANGNSNPLYNLPIDAPKYTGVYRMGEGTIDLGFYIAVLATEWKLLNNAGQSTSQTELELYYALKTIHRLDNYVEEIQYGINGEPENGFLGRKDATCFFEFNNFTDESAGFRFGDNYKMFAANKIYITHRESCDPSLAPQNDLQNTMSQDQAIGVIFGLSFVAKLVNSNIEVNGLNLVTDAKNIVDKIVIFIRDRPYNPEIHPWSIVGPDGKMVCRGGDVSYYSYALAKSAQNITGNNYNNTFSTIVGGAFWGAITDEADDHPGAAYTINLPLGILSQFAIIDLPLFTVGNRFIYNMIMKLAVMSNTWSPNNVAKSSYTMGKEVFDLAGAVLNDYDPVSGSVDDWNYPTFDECNLSEAKTRWENFLASAHCFGPCYDDGIAHSDADYSNSDCFYSGTNTICYFNSWKLENRWAESDMVKLPESFNIHDASTYYWGDYNGLDYMLGYNLYCLAFNIPLTYFGTNGIQRNISGIIPVNIYPMPHPFGNDAYPVTFRSPDKINSVAKIQSDGNLTYRAANEINLLPGFLADVGSDFTAEIFPFECTANTFDNGNSVVYRFSDTTKEIKEPIIILKPNPTSEQFIISVIGLKNFTIEIFDLLGRKIYSGNFTNNEIELKTNDWPKGTYLVNISDNFCNFHKAFKQVVQ